MPARYRWVALSNTSLAVFMSAVDGSIVIIALPAIFRLLAAGAVLLAAFVGIERMVRDPLFQLSLFRIRAFTAGILVAGPVSGFLSDRFGARGLPPRAWSYSGAASSA